MMKGMDVEAGKTASQQITAGAHDLDQLTTKMTQVIEGFAWTGPDADRTRDQWKSDFVAMLTKVSGSLQDFSTLINNQAAEQEQVSA